MYNVKDNAEAKLQVGLSSLATTLVVELGNGMLFPEAPFIAVLNKRDSDGKITKSEKVEVITKDGDQFTVNRGFEGTTPQDFNAGDFFSLFVLARHIQDLQGGIEANATNIGALGLRMTSAEEAINELEKAGAIDHLEEKVMIGEKITSSDKVFLQYTPKASDSIIGIPVGSTVNNTQIHIQRSSSGKAGNTIKMKIRSVGEPTTKVVLDIQRASIVDATNEYYRYGDGTTIATAELPYSTFSNDWQEVTFTFNNEFGGGDEQELLSVVVHQNDNIVNASNYYEIACDGTQYSEAFRFIYCDSNQTVISYEKLMPYCEGDGLASMMLCRCDSATYTINYDYPLLTNYNNYCSNPSYPLYEVINTKYSRNIHVKGNVYGNRSSSYSNRNGYITIYDGGNATVYRTQSGSNGNFDEAIDESYTLSSNTANLILFAGSTYNGRSGGYTNFSVYGSGCRVTKTQNGILVKIIYDETLSVGDTIQATTIGMIGDSYFEGGIYCVDDVYDITISGNISGFIAPTNGLLACELSVNDNLQYRIEVNRIPVIKGTKGTSWQVLHIKKGDEVLGFSNSSATFYGGK